MANYNITTTILMILLCINISQGHTHRRKHDEYENEIMKEDELIEKIELLKQQKESQKQEELEKLVDENKLRVLHHGTCFTPVPVCQRIHSNGRIYKPECALVHRCAPDFGCCKDPGEKCLPHKIQETTLYFHSIKISEIGISVPEIIAEKYINHTECMCQKPNMPIINVNPEKLPRAATCMCPNSFVPEHHNWGCSCFCADKKCKKLRNGRTAFPETDINCITSGRCGTPKCRYGKFSFNQKRCPTRREMRNTKRPKRV